MSRTSIGWRLRRLLGCWWILSERMAWITAGGIPSHHGFQYEVMNGLMTWWFGGVPHDIPWLRKPPCSFRQSKPATQSWNAKFGDDHDISPLFWSQFTWKIYHCHVRFLEGRLLLFNLDLNIWETSELRCCMARGGETGQKGLGGWTGRSTETTFSFCFFSYDPWLMLK